MKEVSHKTFSFVVVVVFMKKKHTSENEENLFLIIIRSSIDIFLVKDLRVSDVPMFDEVILIKSRKINRREGENDDDKWVIRSVHHWH